jgi:hypothetical protein
MHADATATAEAVDLLDGAVEQVEAGGPWGLITTRHDVLAAFHGRAIRGAGVWPDLHFPVYGVDTDYYRRIRLAGLAVIDRPEIARLVHHPERSANLADPTHRAFVEAFDHIGYYEKKWGGPAGGERFARPWDGAPLADSPAPPVRSRLERVAGTLPFREFTDADDREQSRHLADDDWLYQPGRRRYLCSLLGAVEEEVRESRPDLARLVREAVMIGRRMNDFGAAQDSLDWAAPPKHAG